jgi:putative glutamine amidotransferase
MSASPLVGVTTSVRGSTLVWWFYWLALSLAGLRPVRLTADAHDGLKELDGLLIGGGDDISAEIYQGEPTLDVRIDPARDRLELEALQAADKRGVPILGVCRGAQMINVYFGGSLHQSIYDAYEQVPRMWSPLPRKLVTVSDQSELKQIMRVRKFRANSLHTQSIDRLGSGLQISASDSYGIVQGIEGYGNRFLIGVQWHPEFMIYRSAQRRIFSAFRDAVCEQWS